MAHEYPTDDEPPELLVRFEITARRASDFALCEETHPTEAEAHRAAKAYFARGFGVIVRRVVKETIAEWDYPRVTT